MSPRETKLFATGTAFGLMLAVAMLYIAACYPVDSANDSRFKVASPAAPVMLGHSDIDGYMVYSWTAPTSGTPVEYYTMRITWSVAGIQHATGIPNKYFPITKIPGNWVKVAVAGIDSLGVMGPYSLDSEDFWIPEDKEIHMKEVPVDE